MEGKELLILHNQSKQPRHLQLLCWLSSSRFVFIETRLCFYQTRSAWSVDQGSNKNHSPAYNFAPTVTKFCVMWEGLSLPHGTKFGNCRCKIVDSRAFPSWSLIHGIRWSGLIKAEPDGIHSAGEWIFDATCGGNDRFELRVIYGCIKWRLVYMRIVNSRIHVLSFCR